MGSIFRLFLWCIPVSMKYKSVALFFVSVVVCIAFFELPWYNTWFKAKMVCDNCRISAQSQYMENRRAANGTVRRIL
jgi:hypothetical protein